MPKWYYSKEGAVHGPLPIEELQELALEDGFADNNYFLRAGDSDWGSFASMAGILDPASLDQKSHDEHDRKDEGTDNESIDRYRLMQGQLASSITEEEAATGEPFVSTGLGLL